MTTPTLLTVSGVWKSLDAPVLRGVELAVPERAVVALLGASGCGKTTLLRLIAGFEAADRGSITMGARTLDAPGTHVPAERRRIGYVPQEGTLFPHLTVAGNVGFGLSRAERASGRVAEALALTGLGGLERRYPHELSGGQQQRTALARALAPRPSLILLDEPFNALDLSLRRSVCADVVEVLRANRMTAILVTHDPEEAFAAADLVAVMQGGVVAQCADPATVYAAPADLGVARLTGPVVLLPGLARNGVVQTVLGELSDPAVADGPVQVMLRREQIVLADNGVSAVLRQRAFRGDHTLLSVTIEGLTLELRLPGTQAGGDVVRLAVTGGCRAFPIEV